VRNEAELTQESKQNSAQIILKVPENFLKRFDQMSEQLGYTRTEAIREAMRRFQEQGEQRLMQRPETAAENMKQMMTAVFSPIFEMAAKAEETEKLHKKNKLVEVPQKKAI